MGDELDEHPAGRTGVQERHGMAPSAGSRLLVDGFEAHGRGRVEGRPHVWDLEGEVVEPRPSTVEEPGDWPLVVEGFEQFEVGLAGVEKDQLEAVECLLVDHDRVQESVEELGQALGVVGRDADVVQSHDVPGLGG